MEQNNKNTTTQSNFTISLPTDQAAERAVIGSILLDGEKIDAIADILTPADFTDKRNATLYHVITKLHAAHMSADLVTIMSQPEIKEEHSEVTESYLKDIIMSVPSSTRAAEYAGLVYDAAKKRDIIRQADRLKIAALDATKSTDEVVEDVEKTMLELTKTKKNTDAKSMAELVSGCLESIKAASESKDGITGLSTGFYDLDHMTYGLNPGQYIIVAARPAMGKTAFALNITHHVAVRKKVPVLVFSMEMSDEELTSRLIAQEAGVDLKHIETEAEWDGVYDASEVIAQAPIYIEDKPALTIQEMRSLARRHAAKHEIGLIVIDYIQLMSGATQQAQKDSKTAAQTLAQQLSFISAGIKAMAKELRVPVIVLAQLNRACESRVDKRPMLSDIRDSGSFEQDADIVTFLYRDEYYDEDTTDKGVAELIVAKQRGGKTGLIKLGWQPQYTRFVNLERRH